MSDYAARFVLDEVHFVLCHKPQRLTRLWRHAIDPLKAVANIRVSVVFTITRQQNKIKFSWFKHYA